jgi:hypothetical protein
MNPPPAFLALALGAAVLASCGDARRELPGKVGVSAVLTSTGSGFFMEGCASTVYRLSGETAAAVRQRGLRFFAGIAPPPNQNPRNPYGAWRETPLPAPEKGDILALGAIGGCDGDTGDFHTREIEAALRAPGSFYALTANREGMLVVAPGAGIAAFLYYG